MFTHLQSYAIAVSNNTPNKYLRLIYEFQSLNSFHIDANICCGLLFDRALIDSSITSKTLFAIVTLNDISETAHTTTIKYNISHLR